MEQNKHTVIFGSDEEKQKALDDPIEHIEERMYNVLSEVAGVDLVTIEGDPVLKKAISRNELLNKFIDHISKVENSRCILFSKYYDIDKFAEIIKNQDDVVVTHQPGAPPIIIDKKTALELEGKPTALIFDSKVSSDRKSLSVARLTEIRIFKPSYRQYLADNVKCGFCSKKGAKHLCDLCEMVNFCDAKCALEAKKDKHTTDHCVLLLQGNVM